jgi:hypothetical protein
MHKKQNFIYIKNKTDFLCKQNSLLENLITIKVFHFHHFQKENLFLTNNEILYDMLIIIKLLINNSILLLVIN